MKIAVSFQYGDRITVLTVPVTYSIPRVIPAGGCSLSGAAGTNPGDLRQSPGLHILEQLRAVGVVKAEIFGALSLDGAEIGRRVPDRRHSGCLRLRGGMLTRHPRSRARCPFPDSISRKPVTIQKLEQIGPRQFKPRMGLPRIGFVTQLAAFLSFAQTAAHSLISSRWDGQDQDRMPSNI